LVAPSAGHVSSARRFNADRAALLRGQIPRGATSGASFSLDLIGSRVPASQLMTGGTPKEGVLASRVRLRPYQLECLERIHAQYRAGKRRMLVSLPTGTGKTVIFAQFPSFFRMQRRLLVLAHREELIEQARTKFRAANPGMTIGIEQGQQHASSKAKVVLASVPTLGREGSGRLLALDPDEFHVIVVDEAHHAVASTYRRVLEHFRVFEPDTKRLVVGFTATPRRGDGRGLGEIFQDISYTKGLEEMIAANYLCRIRGWRVKTKIDLDRVQTSRGDFVEAQLSRAVDNDARNRLLLRAYREFAPDRRCLVFCVDVQHEKDVAETFRAGGIKAAAVWGDMPREERRDTLKKFSAGRLDVITNCNVLTEGFDEPRVDCVLMARPTQSLLLYAQMVGRGTRLHPDKRDLVVIDVADNTTKHTLAGLQMLFDIPETLGLGGRDVLKTLEELRKVTRRSPWVDVRRIEKAEDLEFVAERVDLFRFDPPDEIATHSDFTWLPSLGGGYRLSLPKGGYLQVQPNLLDRWEIRSSSSEEGLGQERDLPAALATAEEFLQRTAPDSVKLVRRDAAWRDLEATAPQLHLLQRMRIPAPEALRRGEASWLITLAKARVEELNAATRR
jgi:ATP-dependent helicase IRC3